MPTLDQYSETTIPKLLVIGNSGSGKTGSLISLIEAGFKLAIIDFDAGLDFVVRYFAAKPQGRKLLRNVHVLNVRDKVKLAGDEIIPEGQPKACAAALKALDNGDFGDGDNIGPLGKLGPDWVVVIDSLSMFGKAALIYHTFMSPAKDKRQNYHGAQQIVLGAISKLTSEDFATPVIVFTHVTLSELQDGTVKGLPAAIGSAIAGEIPKYFNTMLEITKSGTGQAIKRVISTVPSHLVDIKLALPPGTYPKSLPIESGMATIFEAFGLKSSRDPKKSG